MVTLESICSGHVESPCKDYCCKGSVLTYLAEAGHFGDFPPQGQYDVNLDSILRRAFGKFCAYKKSHKLDCSQPRFTPARCNRRNRASWACLNSKAIASKIISFWLTDEVSSWAMRPAATELDKRVATVMYTYVELFKLMDGCGAIFGEAEAQEFYEKGLLHLQIYSQLRLQSSRTFGASSPMRYLFHLLPKHHYMMHMVYDVRETLINPRFHTLLCAESFIGIMGRISKACHRATLSKRVLERYLVKLGLRVHGKNGTHTLTLSLCLFGLHSLSVRLVFKASSGRTHCPMSTREGFVQIMSTLV